ncbi:transposase [Dactylosporangium sp. CA-152071]|uniref:transposase n=1 Tax=Dactylosporangium sp. CA-152071 TaxID=3239933 RepID=UPI003D8B8A2F
MRLLATVLGQDLETGRDGVLRIARKVAPDRVISTVDPEARHGHKTSHRGFDGYKGHIAVDPDSELITATAVTAGNTGDAEPAAGLIADLTEPAGEPTGDAAVYGDSAYGAGEVLDHLHTHRIDAKTKVQPPNAPAGKFTKDRFTIDLGTQQVTCPNDVTIPIRPVRGHDRHAGKADFGRACTTCPLRAQCTDSKTGRQITISHWERHLAAARIRQQDPAWQSDYRATRPKVERKIAHLMRRRHGGRHARMRGRARIAADFNLLAAAVNLARLATLGLVHAPHRGWALT